MTDPLIDMLVRQQRIATTLEIALAVSLLTALVSAVYIALSALRRRPIPAKATILTGCALVLCLAIETARTRVQHGMHQTVEKAIQDEVRTSPRQVPSDVVSLYR